MSDLGGRIQELIDKYTKIYAERTGKSRELFERARRVLPGGTTYQIRYFAPYPIYITRASGVKVWDVDGNEYVDYWMGHGTHILGHSPDFVVKAVNEAAYEGTHLGYPNTLEVEYAELLAKVIPNVEMVRFSNSGTEANMYAVRLARAYTGRRYVIKMEGGWHGGYDGLHVGVSPPFEGPESLGLPPEHIKYTLVVPFNDLNALENALRNFDVAAVIVEPVLGSGGCIEPQPGYLKGVRELVDRYGALLIFDEVITGFRLALGGGQELFNVKADIVTLGKIVGGGYPGAGAIASRTEIMELLNQVKRPNARARSFHGGTFTGNRITLTAGYTLINYLSQHKPLYESFNDLWNWVRGEIDRACEEYGRICWATGVGGMLGIHFTRSRPMNARMAYADRIDENLYSLTHLFMRVKGILYMTEHTAHLLPSMIHTRDHARVLMEEFRNLLSEVMRR
ncbi:aspartate aminotransferase family protein [Vulcanisaeta distributa]|uniref:glutamate-1-semialdehyde 2,1-aminomutase n=1 Tax=Vulcanisaeta distributa (strain DSM 14429 / JCM 11212 / NBRC 100878 / IC-017) TaxID=572478 RepID=E1QRJ1_VULDI|nr:aspartate aminotransferase family protein [Vulcanisaeta distributa]ADN51805.1 aminotransferase class-III [Vulcanisaeta distributa DSM 14429]